MLGNQFYFGLIRKYVTVFGTLFNDIHIERESDNGEIVQLLRVPIQHSNKDKMLAMLAADPEIDRPYSSLTPRLSFEMQNMRYAGDRKVTTVNRVEKVIDPKSKKAYQYAPVPYDLHFQLHIFAKNSLDAAKILEQILPYFTPDWTPSVHLIPEMNVVMNVPVVLKNVEQDHTIFGDTKKRQNVVWTLDFEMQAYFYGPVKEQGVIKFATVNSRIPATGESMEDAIGTTPEAMIYTVRPGLTANGSPTTSLELTIPLVDIDADDDWGYIESTTYP